MAKVLKRKLFYGCALNRMAEVVAADRLVGAVELRRKAAAAEEGIQRHQRTGQEEH